MPDYIFNLKQKNPTTLKVRGSNIIEAKKTIVKRCFQSFNGLSAEDFSLELDRVLTKKTAKD